MKSIVIYIIKEEIDLIAKTVMITVITAWVKKKKGTTQDLCGSTMKIDSFD
ncbi:hypothetical protein MHI57_20465 [Cytobacillus sp. FSL K6-0129]